MKRIKIPRINQSNSLKGSPRPTEKKDKHKLAKWMKVNPTVSERLFMEAWKQAVPVKILPQVVMMGFIVDFYVKSKKLVIEIDGMAHDTRKDYDTVRDEIFRRNGFNVLRLQASAVVADPIGTVLAIRDNLETYERPISPKRIQRLELPR